MILERRHLHERRIKDDPYKTLKVKNYESNKAKENKKRKSNSLGKRKMSLKQNEPTKNLTKFINQVEKKSKNLVEKNRLNQHNQQARVKRQMSLKSLSSKNSKTLGTKTQKYIFNALKTYDSKSTLKISHSNYSTSNSKYNAASNCSKFSDSTKKKLILNTTQNGDFCKLKKKKHDYIKKFNNTSTGFDKSISTPSYKHKLTQFNENVPNLHIKKKNQEPQNSQKFPYKNISQLRTNTLQLSKQLKKSQKKKLLLITEGYEKIINDLYREKSLQNDQLPNCKLSPITNKQNFNKLQKQIQLPSTAYQTVSQHSYNDLENNDKAHNISETSNYSNQTSEHWDSYLDINYPQNKEHSGLENSSPKIMLNLPLEKIKKQPILQYQEEFMQMQQFFSDSWKRDLNLQKRI